MYCCHRCAKRARGRGLQGSPGKPAMPREWSVARVCVGVGVCLGPYSMPDILPGASTPSLHINPTKALRVWPCNCSHVTDEEGEAQSTVAQERTYPWSEIPLGSLEPPSRVSQWLPKYPRGLAPEVSALCPIPVLPVLPHGGVPHWGSWPERWSCWDQPCPVAPQWREMRCVEVTRCLEEDGEGGSGLLAGPRLPSWGSLDRGCPPEAFPRLGA